MANVLGYAAGWEGFIAAMGLAPGSLSTASMTSTAGFAQANRIDIAAKIPAGMVWTFTAQQNLFASLFFEQVNLYTASPNTSGIRGRTHKLICFYNSAGLLLFSLGYIPSSYTTAASYVTSGKADTLQVFFYGSDQVTPVATTVLGNFPVKATGDTTPYRSYYPSASLKISTYLTATGESTALEFIINGVTVNIPASSLQAGVKDIAKVTIGEFISTSALASYISLPLSQVVLADAADHSLQAGVVRPLSLTGNNQFSGVVTDINTVSQDSTFMASSSEVAAILECTVSQLQQLQSCKIERLSLFVMARYVQAGGTSVNFTCSLVNSNGDIHSSAVVNIAANEDYAYWRTNPVLVTVNNLLTSAKFTYAELLAMRIRISI